MSRDLMTNDRVDLQASRLGREGAGGHFLGLRMARTLFDRSGRERGPRPPRRATPGVEAVEPRVSLSSFMLQQPGVIHGVEDPNIRSPGVIRAFNPQPDPPTRSARIIAI